MSKDIRPYQELFQHLHEQHDLILLDSEMQEIIKIVQLHHSDQLTEKPSGNVKEEDGNPGQTAITIDGRAVCFIPKRHPDYETLKSKIMRSLSQPSPASDLMEKVKERIEIVNNMKAGRLDDYLTAETESEKDVIAAINMGHSMELKFLKSLL